MKKIVTMALAAAAFMSLAVFWPKGQVASAAAAVTEEDPYGILAELPQTREAPAGAYLLEQVLPVAYGKVYRFARMEFLGDRSPFPSERTATSSPSTGVIRPSKLRPLR